MISDVLYPDAGGDPVRGGDGNDEIHVTDDDEVDKIFCGEGNDEVHKYNLEDALDDIAEDCEYVGI